MNDATNTLAHDLARLAAIPTHDVLTVDLPLPGKQQGKVRDIWVVGDRRVIVTTDRQSAFDRVVGTVPYKGQVLTRLAQWWFERTDDIVPNHVIDMPDPNVLIAREARVWPVEMVIRGYITGVTKTALWHNYSQGKRTLYGIVFPDGLRKNERLPAPVITPTTKAASGAHDEMLSRDDVLASGVVPPDVYAAMEDATRRLFARGQELAAERGLILVDTKYEFGDIDGVLTLVDEIHTVDSSRFWMLDNYAARFAAGEEPETFDKEFLRRWYVDEAGYRGDGDPPALPRPLAERMSRLYIEAFERLTGEAFVPDTADTAERMALNLRVAGVLS